MHIHEASRTGRGPVVWIGQVHPPTGGVLALDQVAPCCTMDGMAEGPDSPACQRKKTGSGQEKTWDPSAPAFHMRKNCRCHPRTQSALRRFGLPRREARAFALASPMPPCVASSTHQYHAFPSSCRGITIMRRQCAYDGRALSLLFSPRMFRGSSAGQPRCDVTAVPDRQFIHFIVGLMDIITSPVL